MVDFLAPIVRNVIYPMWMTKSTTLERKYLQKLRTSQYLPPPDLERLREKRLAQTLQRAYSSIPYYRRTFDTAGFAPAENIELDMLDRLPILSKVDIQNNRDELVSTDIQRDMITQDRTGGSTGEPITFYYDWERQLSRNAAAHRHNEWADWRVGDKAAVLWAASRDIPETQSWRLQLRGKLLERTRILDAGSLTEDRLDTFVRTLEQFKPKVVLAYANTMALFAEYVRHRNIPDLKLRSIVCSAEVLTSQARKLIEKTFNCPVFNRYGSREFSVIASECEHHDGMHINAEALLVEVVDSDGRPTDGTGEILVTDLMNKAMPLIRYRIGDIGRLVVGDCACGRTLPRLELSDGRTTDFFVTPAGLAVSGVAISTYVLPRVEGLETAQLHQRDLRSLDVLAVFKNPDSARAYSLEKRLKEYLGNEIQIDIRQTESIASEVSGKFRFLKSDLDESIVLKAISKTARSLNQLD